MFHKFWSTFSLNFLPISQQKIEESTYDSLSVRSRISFIEEYKKPLNKPIVTKPIISEESEDPIKEGQFISVGGESTTTTPNQFELSVIRRLSYILGVFYLGERKQ